MPDGPDLDALFDLVLAGGPQSRKAFDPLFRRSYAYVRSKGVPSSHANDVVSGVIEKLLRKGLPPTRDNRAGYLYRILANAAMDWHRNKPPPLPPGPPPGPGPDEDESARTERREECLRKALAAFALDSEERATVLRLTYLEGWSQTKVAEHIGRSYGATREFLYQTRKQFRQLLLQMCSEVLTVGALEP